MEFLVTRHLLVETSLIFEAIKNELIALEPPEHIHWLQYQKLSDDLGELCHSTGKKESVSRLWFPEGETTLIFRFA